MFSFPLLLLSVLFFGPFFLPSFLPLFLFVLHSNTSETTTYYLLVESSMIKAFTSQRPTAAASPSENDWQVEMG